MCILIVMGFTMLRFCLAPTFPDKYSGGVIHAVCINRTNGVHTSFLCFSVFLLERAFSVSRDVDLAHQASSMYPRFPPSVGSGTVGRLSTCILHFPTLL